MMLSLQGVTKTFGSKTALDNLSFSLEGGVVGFLGENGAGKTTTLRLITGLLLPDSGKVSIMGHDLWEKASWTEVRRQTGYLPNEPVLFEGLTGLENLELLSHYRTGNRASWKQFEGWIEPFGLQEAMQKPLGECSSGMRRKLELLASAVGEPAILLWDEPHNSLDILSNIRMQEFVKAYSRPGRLVFFSSHIVEMVEAVADQVLILHQGRLAHQGPCRPGMGLAALYLEATGGR